MRIRYNIRQSRINYQKICSLAFIFTGILYNAIFSQMNDTFRVNSDNQELEIRFAGEFNHLPIGCSVIGMGNTGVVLPYRKMCFFWNPALVSLTTEYEITMEGAKLYGGLSSLGSLSFSAPIQNGLSAGILYKAFFPDDILEYDSLPGNLFFRQYNYNPDGYVPVGVFHNNHHNIIVAIAKVFNIPIIRPTSYAVPLPVDFGIGLNIKSLWMTMTPGDKVRMGYNINLDAGFFLRLGVDYDLSKQEIRREILIAASLRDFLHTRMIWLHSYENYEEPVDFTHYYGLCYIDRSGFLRGNWTISLALHKMYEVSLHAGLEGEFFDMVSFRCGISNRIISLGTGIHYRNYSLDYSFSFDEIAFSFFRLAIGVGF